MTDSTPKKRGRPPKKQGKNPVGRPKGEAGIMKEYRERMLNSPKSRKVLDSIFEAALNDEHKNQAAAWKLIVDRIVPVSGFEKMAGTSGRSAITVNISGVGSVDVGADAPSGDAIEGEYIEEPSE
jgi:nitrate reductase alpha subunit